MLAKSEAVEQIVQQVQHLSPEQRLRLIQRITETLLPMVTSSSRVQRTQEFEAELANFERLKPMLLQQHRGQFVAVYQGEVIAVGDNRMEVLAAAEAAVGNVSFYVGEVTENGPRRVRMPSPHIIR